MYAFIWCMAWLRMLTYYSQSQMCSLLWGVNEKKTSTSFDVFCFAFRIPFMQTLTRHVLNDCASQRSCRPSTSTVDKMTPSKKESFGRFYSFLSLGIISKAAGFEAVLSSLKLINKWLIYGFFDSWLGTGLLTRYACSVIRWNKWSAVIGDTRSSCTIIITRCEYFN